MVPQPNAALLRFGPKRRNWRDYPLKLRRFGLTSGDRIQILKIKQQMKLVTFAIAMNEDNEEEDDEKIEEYKTLLVHLLTKLRRITRPHIPLADRVNRRRVRIDYFTDEDTFITTGFSIADNREIFDKLEVPANFIINDHQGLRYSFKVNGEHAYMFSMSRIFQGGRTLFRSEEVGI